MKNNNNHPSNSGILLKQNHRHRGTGGTSQNNKKFKFSPAFFDSSSKTIYLSCYADGKPAPIHMLDGLPKKLLKNRTITDSLINAKNALVSGYISGHKFLTRQQAADILKNKPHQNNNK